MSDDKTPEKSIFQDKSKLLDIWKDERRSRDNSADLMWENLKFFSVLITALITANTFFLNLAVDNLSLGNSLFSLVLPSLIILLSIFGYRDMARRWRRTLEAIAHLIKLEGLLGLREPIPEELRNALKENSRLFERSFNTTQGYDTQDKFIDDNMNKRNMFKDMGWVYLILAIAGGCLLVFAALLIVDSTTSSHILSINTRNTTTI
jgi:hypothetical protein